MNLTYAQVSWLDKLKIFFTLIPLPLILVRRLTLSSFSRYDRHKTWSRVAGDTTFRYMSSQMNVNQMQYVMGTTSDVYKKWAKKNNQPMVIDDVGDGASLLWFRNKGAKRIAFYLHGGTYQLPMQDYAPPFWLSMLDEAQKADGKDATLVALSYSLYPSAEFPIQLKQAVNGLSHLLKQGYSPSDINLVGDSAGGALILQILSHLLHPYTGVPALKLQKPLGSAFLMSPWVTLSTESPSFTTNTDRDVLPKESWAYLASGIIRGLPATATPYLEALRTPKDWWIGLESQVKKISILTGEFECLRDDDVKLNKILKEHHPSVSLMIQPRGVHTDPYLNRLSGEKDDGRVVQYIVDHFST